MLGAMITSELLIAAPVERVWDLTVDVERWPSLTPTITRVERLDEGEMRLGSQARVKQPAQRAAVWTVTDLEPGSRFVWQTKVGPITMVGGHRLQPTEAGCRNLLTLEVSGLGSRLFERLVGGRIRQAIETENQGFKRAAEAVEAGEAGVVDDRVEHR